MGCVVSRSRMPMAMSCSSVGLGDERHSRTLSSHRWEGSMLREGPEPILPAGDVSRTRSFYESLGFRGGVSRWRLRDPETRKLGYPSRGPRRSHAPDHSNSGADFGCDGLSAARVVVRFTRAFDAVTQTGNPR